MHLVYLFVVLASRRDESSVLIPSREILGAAREYKRQVSAVS